MSIEIFDLINKTNPKREHDLIVLRILLSCLKGKVIEETYLDKEKKLEYVIDLFNLEEMYQEKYIKDNNQTFLNILENNFYSIKEGIDELKDELYHFFKISAIVFLDNLKAGDFNIFNEYFNKIICNFKSVSDACEYVYYHGGKDVSLFISELIDMYHKTNQNISFIPLEYLEKNKNIVTLDYSSFTQLYSKINLSFKLIANSSDEYQDLKERFYKIQVYYFIIVAGENND